MLYEVITKHAMLKYGLQGAPVYTYLFAWESPVLDGIFRSTHCMELPFVFHNVTRVITSYSIHYTKLYEILEVADDGEPVLTRFQRIVIQVK